MAFNGMLANVSAHNLLTCHLSFACMSHIEAEKIVMLVDGGIVINGAYLV